MPRTPAYTRLDVDERRRRLLDVGAALFLEHAYEELSMSGIARAAGVSKALLYHYFPSKREFFRATLRQAAEEVARRTEPRPGLDPLAQLTGSLDGFLGWIEEHPDAYRKLMQSAHHAEVRELIDEIRDATSARILDGLAPAGAPPRMRSAVRAWLWYMDGTCLDWLEHGDMTRAEVRDLLLGTLGGALLAAGWDPAGAAGPAEAAGA